MLDARPPRRLARWLARLPLWLYRAGLGRLLGRRFLLLTHVGRRTGRVRAVVLEALEHDPATGRTLVASGWGERADWLRNVAVTPAVTVTIGARRFRATAVRLSPPAAEAALLRYAGRHPRAFRALVRLLTGRRAGDAATESARLAAALPVVRLEPDRASAPAAHLRPPAGRLRSRGSGRSPHGR